MKLFKEFVEDLELDERELTDKELEDREHNVQRLKKHLGKFKDRYGKDGESIMYAIATRDAKRDKKYEDLELDEALPKSTLYGVVVVDSGKGKVIAKGSKAAMSKLAKQKGGYGIMSPGAKVGDTIDAKDVSPYMRRKFYDVKKEELELDELSKQLLKRYADKASKDIDKRFASAETEKDREKLTKRLRGFAKGTWKYRDKKEYVNYPYGPLDTMRPIADLGDIPNYYGTKLNAQRKKKKVKRNV